ncbi:uncharacterized protein TrAFT101_001020 [Trichoderma asperellum]|uniref:uncharacterized protein n=1 Tax=Trichoderma asperellum TaxID=101201 RepID=UPI003324266A|nr:hypothetical protein TrAFT101_001020 [Trichoderma asperellum]
MAVNHIMASAHTPNRTGTKKKQLAMSSWAVTKKILRPVLRITSPAPNSAKTQHE